MAKEYIERYRKKPVVVEAIQFTRSNFADVAEFTGGKAYCLTIERCPNGQCYCLITTLEGEMKANEGDYIIKGVHGEFYPCKPDIFKKTYEVESAAADVVEVDRLIEVCFHEFCMVAIDSPCGCDGCPYGEFGSENNACYEEYKRRMLSEIREDGDNNAETD